MPTQSTEQISAAQMERLRCAFCIAAANGDLKRMGDYLAVIKQDPVRAEILSDAFSMAIEAEQGPAVDKILRHTQEAGLTREVLENLSGGKHGRDFYWNALIRQQNQPQATA